MNGFRRAAHAAAVALGAALTYPGQAEAQSPTPPVTATPQQLDPASRASAPPRSRRDADLFSADVSGPCPLRGSPLTFTLRSVEFRGSTALSADDLAGSYAGQIGREAPVETICDIRDRAADLFFRRNILARVEIPEQRIADGALVLEVIEARIASVRVRGDAGPAQAKVEDYLEQLRGLAPFDLTIAQRYLLLAADVPGVRLSAAVRPSAAGRGAVDLEVTVSRDAYDGVANVQNFGAESLGRIGGLVRADFNGFTRFGERTSLVAYSTLESDEQQVVQLLSEARLGASGLLVRGSIAYGLSKPGGEFELLDLEGRSFVGELAASYPVVRLRRRRLDVSAGLDWVDQTTEFGAGGTLSEDKLRVVFARADAEVRRFAYGQPLAVSAGLEVRKGLDVAGASQAGDAALSRTDGVPDAWLVRGDFQVEQAFGPYLVARVSALGQHAENPLLSYEELAVGNLTIGRGYDPSSVSGDSGAAASFELQAGPVRPFGRTAVYLLGFYDVALVENNDQGSGDARTVDSVGGGLRLRLTDRVSLDVLYAHPFDSPIEAAEQRPSDRVLFNLIASLY